MLEAPRHPEKLISSVHGLDQNSLDKGHFDLAVHDPIGQSGFMFSVLLLPPISAKLRFAVYEPLD